MADNNLEILLEESIRAQNRTTHAVRAIASFVIIQVPYGFAGAAVFIGSLPATDRSGWLALAGFIWFVGFAHSLGVAISELSKSKRGLVITQSISDDDWMIAMDHMNSVDQNLWMGAGEPPLKPWLDAGKPDIRVWLKENERL